MEESIEARTGIQTGIERETKTGIKIESDTVTSEVSVSETTVEAHIKEVQPETKQTGDLLEDILAAFPGKRQDVRAYSPLALAYMGDAIYDLIIRTVVVERANRPANQLHHITVKYVSASAQAKIVEELLQEFTEEEQAVYRRGRNSKPHTMAKNASAGDYLKATGFEAVLGHLYLSGRLDRVLELVKRGIDLVGLTL